MLVTGSRRRRGEGGQGSLLLLGVGTRLLGLAVVFFAFGSALGSKGKHQRAADLAAVSAGQVLRDLYPRLFEPPVLANGLPNPQHLPLPAYQALVRRAAVRGARRNGVEVGGADVSFPGGGFAPTRVAVRVRGVARVRVKQGGGRGGRRKPVPVEARAAAEIAPDRTSRSGCRRSGRAAATTGRWRTGLGKPRRTEMRSHFGPEARAVEEARALRRWTGARLGMAGLDGASAFRPERKCWSGADSNHRTAVLRGWQDWNRRTRTHAGWPTSLGSNGGSTGRCLARPRRAAPPS
jgi:hypothetical protein